MLQKNEGHWQYTLDETSDGQCIELAVDVGAYLDTSLIKADVQPLHVRLLIKACSISPLSSWMCAVAPQQHWVYSSPGHVEPHTHQCTFPLIAIQGWLIPTASKRKNKKEMCCRACCCSWSCQQRSSLAKAQRTGAIPPATFWSRCLRSGQRKPSSMWPAVGSASTIVPFRSSPSRLCFLTTFVEVLL